MIYDILIISLAYIITHMVVISCDGVIITLKYFSFMTRFSEMYAN